MSSADCECEEKPCPAGLAPWMATFADLMSLLMCFFVLLLSFSELEVQKFKQVAGSLKMAFGVQRDVRATESPMGTSIIFQEFSPGKPDPTTLPEVRQTTTHEQPNIETDREKTEVQQGDRNHDRDKDKDGATPQQINQSALAVAEEILQEQARSEMQRQAEDLITKLEEQIREGLIEIETTEETIIVRIREKGSFPSGSSELERTFLPVLRRIRDEIAATPGLITVAGHTDNVPINTYRFRSNWELAAGRAASVLHFLIADQKIQSTNVELKGLAETEPLVANTTAANRAKNRRVEILLQPGKRKIPPPSAQVTPAAAAASPPAR
jgi:chemotaxis protein MotB